MTYDSLHLATGFDYVLVGGTVAVDQDVRTTSATGKLLRRAT